MKINPIAFTQSNQQNQTSFNGLYFVKNPTVLFDKSANLRTGRLVPPFDPLLAVPLVNEYI